MGMDREGSLARIRCDVISGGDYRFPRGWRLADRRLPHYVVYTVLEGHLAVSAATTSVVRAGWVVVVPPEIAHDVANQNGVSVRFVTTHVRASLDDHVELRGSRAMSLSLGESWAGVRAAVLAIVDEVEGPWLGHTLASRAHAQLLLALFARVAGEQDREDDLVACFEIPQVERVGPALAVIHERYAERLHVRDLAAVAHLSPSRFAAVFRGSVGIAPMRYLARHRLAVAEALLLDTDLTLEEVAIRTGHDSASYLGRVFRRERGVSPAGLRSRRLQVNVP